MPDYGCFLLIIHTTDTTGTAFSDRFPKHITHMPIKLFLFAITSLLALSLRAEQGRYEMMVKNRATWTIEKLNAAADSMVKKGVDDEAMVLYMMAASRPTNDASPDEIKNQVEANLHAGDIHYAKGNYANALRYYVTGLKLSESSQGRPYLPVLYKNMGNVYNMFQDYEKGQSLYLRGLEAAKHTGDYETAYKLLQNLVGVSINLNDVVAARRYFEQSQSTKHKSNDESRYMDGYTLALILKHEGKDIESIAQFRKLARKARQTGIGARYECSAYGEMARIYDHMGQTDSTLHYLTRCKDVAQGNGILHQFVESLKMLYTIYEQRGNTLMATALKNRYLEMKDSIYNQRQFDMAKNQQFLYEIEKTEKMIADLNDRQARNAVLINRQRITMVCAFVVIVLVLLLSYYFYRQKKRLSESYRNLYEMHQRLTETNKEARQKNSFAKENDSLRAEIARLKDMLETAAKEDADNYGYSNADLLPPSIDTPSAEKEIQDNPETRQIRTYLGQEQKEKLAEAIVHIMENLMPFCSADFSLNSLAASVNSNIKYVSIVINDVFKKNFSTFVNEYRVNLACERLADNDGFENYSISGIGESVGFKSNATFTTVFKKFVGITPSVYYKLAKETRNKAPKHGI